MQPKNQHDSTARPLLITRLTALWALNEAVLGGVLHGISLPITGLTVGAVAVLLVCLIGYYGRRGDVLKATLIVCIIKATLSPHTPPPAYIAVLFQGVLGSLLVSGRGVFMLRCIAFAILALLESALQKLLMLTVLFGMEFWAALDQFVSKLLKQLGAQTGPYGSYLVAGYLALHVLAGVGVGLVAGRLPALIKSARWRHADLLLPEIMEGDALPSRKASSKWKVRPLLLGIWIVLTVLLVQAWIQPEQAWLPAGEALRLLVRSVVVLLAWYMLVGPLLLRLIKNWMERRKGALQAEVQAVLILMPATLALARQCWQASAREPGLGRLRGFMRLLAVNLFSLDDER